MICQTLSKSFSCTLSHNYSPKHFEVVDFFFFWGIRLDNFLISSLVSIKTRIWFQAVLLLSLMLWSATNIMILSTMGPWGSTVKTTGRVHIYNLKELLKHGKMSCVCSKAMREGMSQNKILVWPKKQSYLLQTDATFPKPSNSFLKGCWKSFLTPYQSLLSQLCAWATCCQQSDLLKASRTPTYSRSLKSQWLLRLLLCCFNMPTHLTHAVTVNKVDFISVLQRQNWNV